MLDPANPALNALIDAALAEDIGRGDITSRLAIPARARGEFAINARHAMVLAGLPLVPIVFRKVEPEATIELLAEDGARVDAGRRLARIAGPARGLLGAERTALNFLQLLTGIATLARHFVDAIAHTKAVMVDTRKTIPGYRDLSKYAARMGGVRNHRLRLDDGVLIKDNHIAIAGGIAAALAEARRGTPLLTKIEVECDTLDQVKAALDAGADMILLDNMAPAMLRQAVALAAGRVPLEASGGVRLDTVAAIAETGVDFISSGRITQAAPAADIGLDVRISA